jgi:hypothetical protein
MRNPRLLLLLGWASACGPAGIASDASSRDADSGDESSTVNVPEEASSDGESSTGDGDGEPSCELPPLISCGPDPECPAGQKCGSVQGEDCFGTSYGFTACVPVIGDQSVGQSCTITHENIEPNATLQLDDCDANSSCRSHVANGDEGTCLAWCEGDGRELICADPQRVCSGGESPVCVQTCDPLAEPSCEGGFACGVHLSWPGDEFTCGASSESDGQLGDGCASSIGCATGFGCLDVAQLQSCDSEVGCCTPLCSLDDLEGCAELGPGYTCVPFYEEQAPAGLEHVGLCAWN